jgi:hypothetical protein
MAATMIRQRTEATPATWQRMLHKALDEGIAVRQLGGSGAWIATSGTDPNGACLVSLAACECPGHEFGGYCKHRAKLAHHLGRLTLRGPEPEPEPPAPAALALVPCDCCHGRGVAWVGTGLEMEQVQTACLVCGGAGELETDEGGEPDGDDARQRRWCPPDAGPGSPRPSPQGPGIWVGCGAADGVGSRRRRSRSCSAVMGPAISRTKRANWYHGASA